MSNDFLSVAIYLVISVLLSALDFTVCFKSFKHKKRGSILLGMTSLFAGIVNISYSASVIIGTYFAMSLISSIYFMSIDVMVLSIMGFSFLLDKAGMTKVERILTFVFHFYAAIDMAIFLINPFREIAVSYSATESAFPKYQYEFHPLYNSHLLFTYIMILITIIVLIVKAIRVPKEYRNPYIYNVVGIIAIVIINAIFLFSKGDNFIYRIDVSTNTYSFVICLLYWSYFKYSTHGMLNKLKNSLFENIDKGIVLFDYNKFLILYNNTALSMLEKKEFADEMKLETFAEENKIVLRDSSVSNYSFQYYKGNNENQIPLRCDYKVLKNSNGRMLGYLLMFSDIALETDILTGFHNWESFKLFAINNPDQFEIRSSIAIIDINALAVINSSFGRNVGDQKIKELSDLMRKHFPDNTYFVRGHEAHLIAICQNCDETTLRDYVESVSMVFSGKIQYALNTTDDTNNEIVSAIREASKAMKTKKLLDDSSSHSELISTLVKALEECDNDTEQHVQRTREMGAQLGKRIGLSDIQLSNLSLLCLLHDIGKIGIPLEILNKPGKLTEEEWVIMRTHTEKGYQITASAKELEPIADMVLHHHERWDGMGYPDGLSKESIPILSRVISVIDSYDAMVNDRIYRPALPVETAIAELKKGAGTQFDPHIVSEFITMINEDDGKQVVFRKSKDVIVKENECEEIVNENVSSVRYSRYILDKNKKILKVDSSFEYFTGYNEDYIKNNDLYQVDLIPESDRMLYVSMVAEQLSKNSTVYFEHRLKKKNGESIFVLCIGEYAKNQITREYEFNVIISNIMHTQAVKSMIKSEQDKAKKRLKQWETQYRTDSLTGLMNHSAFKNDIEAKMLAGRHKVMLIMMDLDKFKQFNDTYGHNKGDEFLILTAQILQNLIRRETDLACRMGGDEFALALFFRIDQSEEKMYNKARQIFDSLCASLSTAVDFAGASMGAAISDNKTILFSDLYEEADKMLYKAKEEGRNRICCKEVQYK